MNIPRYAASAAKLLQESLSSDPVVTHDRARGLDTIERAMRARAQRRRGLLVLLMAAAMATLLAGGATYRYLSRPVEPRVAIQAAPLGSGATLGEPHRAQRLDAPAEMTVGQRVETPPGGGASLQLSTGTNLTLAGETALRVQSQSTVERFSLARGELHARVARLSPGHRFIIQTPDVEVEVRGTRFKVSVLERGDACDPASRTRLYVTEGVVEVRSSSGAARVTAGEYWPANCGTSAPEPSPQGAPPLTSSLPTPATPSGALAISSARRPSEGSSALIRQNDLFAEGVARRRAGDVTGALLAYQELIRQYPASPLAENAAVERLRILSQRQPVRAREEARAYLERYPRGFAAHEARRLTEQP